MSLLTEASLVILPNAVEEGELLSIIPADGSGDMTAVRATTATLVNSEGVIENVAINVPRLDYTNGSCPSILVEPQRTNLALRSEEFDNTSIWLGSSGVVRLANQAVAPDGNNTMDLITFPVSGNVVSQSVTVISGATYTFSVWLATQSGTQTVEIGNINIGVYQIVNVTTTPTRFQVTQVASATNRFIAIRATASCSIYIWGAQLEAGANATSYIPTVASAVTRNADVISKTGISSLIGQTEGTLFVDFVTETTSDVKRITLSNTTSNRIVIGHQANGTIQFTVLNNGSAQVNFITTQTYIKGQRLKIALGYKENDFVGYINGVQIFTDNLGTVPATSKIAFADALDTSIFSGNINSAIIFQTRLSNTELAQLTTL